MNGCPWFMIVTTNKTLNCDLEVVSLVKSNFNFTAMTGRRQKSYRGIIMFMFLRRIVCVDASAYHTVLGV